MNFTEFKEKPSSEKITLATLDGSKRLMGWTLSSGSIYYISNFDFAVVSSLKVSGVPLTQVYSLADVSAGEFYNDRESKRLYCQTIDSAGPNTKFIHVTFKLFYSSSPVSLPWDLNSGFDVFWEPLIKGTSQFGVELDTVNQGTEAIEGSGRLVLHNDQSFWPSNFDKIFFENQGCSIYIWNRNLEPSDAKLLFKGLVEEKTYTSTDISFGLKDLLSSLRDTIQLNNIEDLSLRHDPALAKAKQRMVYGKVSGHRPVNVDMLQNGLWPLTGTSVTATNGSATVTGSGTQFLAELSPNDRIVLGASGTEYTIASIASNTSLTLTENFAESTWTAATNFRPDKPRRFINRVWSVAGHALREPETTTLANSTTTRLKLESTDGIYPGDKIYVGTLGSGELVTVDSVPNSSVLTLSTSLSSNPAAGTAVLRPAVQNVRIDDTLLTFYRDYTINADTCILTLNDNAEWNAAETRESLNQGTFTNGSRTVTGSGTNFKTNFKPGDIIKPFGHVSFYEILSVDSDTQITLRTAVSGLSSSPTTAAIQYKTLIFNPSENVLTCEVLGRTEDDTTSGTMLRYAPDIVKQLLTDAGLQDIINTASFTAALDLLPEELAFTIPSKFGDTTTPVYRDVINQINRSVMGMLYQDDDFKLTYDVLSPSAKDATKLDESDIISVSVKSTNKNMYSSVFVKYGRQEYDYNSKAELENTATATSDIANYILGTGREKTIETLLANEVDAQRLADRWQFLYEFSSNSLTIKTKLQTIDLKINDVVDVTHRKLYERFGGTSKRKLAVIESIKKSGEDVLIEAVDLSNAFNRVGLISDETLSWEDAGEDSRLVSGFYTDGNGLINNDPDSFYSNKIW